VEGDIGDLGGQREDDVGPKATPEGR